ncbi:hypothetical protein F444_22624 [Phytophthora nicotianae P1976]|uniref:ZSWIM1/3 RNaseH-like domain-containing protein n=2 Tax=Phytophthora nicotianae TaxID=4792 RepID=A0A080YX87_PHYNI|nr:hypothetical protein F444_22624 [Phytophthora nicotianae P1976]
MKTSHNHLVDSTTYQYYPVIRTAVGDSVLQTVGALQKAGAGKKNILQFITENSDCTPTIRDVHNLVRKLKARTTQSTTSAQRLKAWMIDFCGEHGNVGRIFVEARQSKKIATCITMQTQHMRYLYDRFPEVLLIDATHGTNAPKYKSYQYSVRVVAEKLTPMLAASTGERFRVQTYESDMGVQLDNYNCGLFILLAFEHFTGAPSLGRMDKKLMMYLRYRYLCMCLH